MTASTVSGGADVYTAAANTDLAASTTYWVVAHGTICVLRSQAPSVHPDWTAGVTKWLSNTGWTTWNAQYLSIEIKGTIHSGPAHEPERPDYEPREPQPVTPKPFCNSSGRDPSGGTECYWESYDQIPTSDPCDQPWQVPGSYRHDRGCLNRY